MLENACMISRSCRASTHPVSEGFSYFLAKKDSNSELLKLTEQEKMGIVLLRRRWRWIGHVLLRENNNISKVALQGKRKKARPKSTWRRTAEAELKTLNLSWEQASWRAKARQEWGKLVDALCATWRVKK